MKKNIFIIIAVLISVIGYSQDFNTNISTAKDAYKAGNLEQAHFALQKAMQEIDMIIGKEVLKLLPAKMDTLSMNTNDDNVSSNMGFAGATIHRSYGNDNRKAILEIISNSPMVAMLNNLFNMPAIAGMNDANSQTIKLQGYKARLERKSGNTEGKYNYELQVPLGSALISFTVDDITEKEMIEMANTIPLAKVAKLIQ